MRFQFEKVTDYKLIAPAVYIANLESNNPISTTKLINKLRENSLLPDYEKTILKGRKDDKFSQKVRNLISHKVLEKYNLAEVDKNKIILTRHGKRIGKFISEKYANETLVNTISIENNPNFKKLLLKSQLNINFDPILLEKLDSFSFSTRAKNLFKNIGISYLGDLILLRESEILRYHNSGRNTLFEIKDFLKLKNLKLNTSINQWKNLDIDIYIKKYKNEKKKYFHNNIDDLINQSIAKSKKQSENSFSREKTIIFERFAVNTNFLTLEEIGDKFGVTRELIRQIQKKFTIKLKKNDQFVYAISKLIDFLNFNTPINEDLLNKKLINHGFFNSYKSFPCLRNIISPFKKFTFDTYFVEGDRSSKFFIVSSKKEEKLLNKIIVYSKKFTLKHGFCNFENLITNIFNTRNYSKFDNIKESLKTNDQFIWFDESNYLVLGGSEKRSTVINTLKKLLYINKKISYEDFIEALINNYRIGSAPPAQLLQKICKVHNLKFDEEYIYYSGEKINLGEGEKKIVKLFKENDEFLTFWECIDLSEKYDINLGSLGLYLYGHHLVKKLDNKVFCLYGTKIDNNKIDLAGARALKQKEKVDDLSISWTNNKKILAQFTLTKGVKIRGFIYIPSQWDKFLEGSYYHHKSKNEVRVANAIWDLKDILQEFDVGYKMNFEFSFNPNTINIF